MQRLEAGLRALGEDTFRRLLLKATNSATGSIASGTLATAVLQSSSMVGLMVLAMVGSGILPLYNAIGMVIGANLGTTITGWLVTLLGFKLSLSEFALPMMGIGGLMFVWFSQGARKQSIGLLIFALGLLLFGLATMKSSVAELQGAFRPAQLADYHSIVFVLVGVAFTAIIQSSSACMLITLNALSAGLIELPMAAAIIIGADLGTTSTMLMGGMAGSANKRRVAAAHVLFNLATAILAYLLLLPFLERLLFWSGITDPLYGLVAFHSFFNLLGVLLVFPFVKHIANMLTRTFGESAHNTDAHLKDIATTNVPVAVIALRQSIQDSCLQAMRVNNRILKLPMKVGTQGPDTTLSYEADYEALRDRIGLLSEYILDVFPHGNDKQKVCLNAMLKMLRHVGYAMKAVKDIRQDLRSSGISGDRSILRKKVQRTQEEMHRLATLFNWLISSQGVVDKGRLQQMTEQAETVHHRFVDNVHGWIQGDDVEGEAFIVLTNISKHLSDMIEQWATCLELLHDLRPKSSG